MKLLDGRKLAEEVLDDTRRAIMEYGRPVCVAWILVGDDPASRLYGRLKERAAVGIGMGFRSIVMSAESSEEEVIRMVDSLNIDEGVQGIIVQLPLPEHLRSATERIIAAVDPWKDADATHPEITRRFLAGESGIAPPVFPRAIMELIASTGEMLSGKHAAVLCHSEWMGAVMQEALRRQGIVSETIFQRELSEKIGHVRRADIVVTACGVPRLITGDMLSSGATVIDGGIAELPDGTVVGDVDYRSVEVLDITLSPVPGGVGPVTVACLLSNVLFLANIHR